ncbi:hypothetical protein CKO_01872 [Citrobacter koseri ATCC BAA-895]|uniref:Uncharacterized protein n=1 Tax=Citrobacter koseri (strain ATCC BAA-895 / CDC 4225-83 / SGSC4696) TaxID=290338 RepID=A8AHN7_CITK8|nr:hypothetical protein CKO_01872 [Citrobacter koseri ATCC BAA-895]
MSQRSPPSHDVAMPLPSVPAAKIWITSLVDANLCFLSGKHQQSTLESDLVMPTKNRPEAAILFFSNCISYGRSRHTAGCDEYFIFNFFCIKEIF